jgi:FMN phosphatase YigB (HAD superfamily)
MEESGLKSPSIQLLVTDLDNTLYDWLAFFVPSFYAMIEVAAPLLGLTEEEIIAEFKIVNRTNGSSEKPFALLDLPSVQAQLGSVGLDEQKRRLDEAFHAFNRVRKQTLKLYDGVLETLDAIQTTGTIIVAHTDAHVENALFRIEKLGLSGVISRLYAPISASSAQDRLGQKGGFVFSLPDSDRKPNPRVLLDICAHHHIEPTRTLYVGDSLVRDISMANRAGTRSALAGYGMSSSPALWEQLVRVTHWSAEAAAKETITNFAQQDATPDVVLSSFPQLLEEFSFSK